MRISSTEKPEGEKELEGEVSCHGIVVLGVVVLESVGCRCADETRPASQDIDGECSVNVLAKRLSVERE